MTNDDSVQMAQGGALNAPGIEIKGITELVKEKTEAIDEDIRHDEEELALFHSTLEGHIRRTYEENKRSREESGIEEEMIRSLYQVNGEYTPKELQRISGSNIWMNITATKSRAGRSWIKDILQPANAFPMEFRPTPVQDLPADIMEDISESFQADADRIKQTIEDQFAKANAPAEQPAQPQEGQDLTPGQPEAPAPEPKKPSALVASKKLRAVSELRRDVDEAILEEINKESQEQARKIQRYVFDDLLEGGWDKAFSDFIDDFTIYPTAFMKGPIVTTKTRLTYKNGVPHQIRDIAYENKRVCPLDVYPSPSAEVITDGNFIEHIRLTKKNLSDLAHLGDDGGYRHENILNVLEQSPAGLTGSYDQKIEEVKARLEKRGSQTSANANIYHGYHFWGTASVKMLLDWGIPVDDVAQYQMWEELEIEAILVNSKVIKCCINKDPLGRRPYYSASYQTRSGSIWGRSMPFLMRDPQRMCNGSARALSDNMGLSSGPQCAILVDRLADDGDITDTSPRKIWQFVSDPQGNGGKPIEFFDVPSKANELLAVYDKFELKADDATGIPRYSYGNEQIGGAGQTLGGLSILMESATKGIKDAIKNISEGVLKPRAEYQFYMHMLGRIERNDPLQYHGDVNVVVYAADAITLKAAEQEAQQALLKATANQFDMEIIGKAGRADMLRTVLKTANFPESIIPSRLELKIKGQEDQDAAAQQQQAAQAAEDKKGNVGLEATKAQVDGQIQMHEKTSALKDKDMTLRDQAKKGDQRLKAVELDQKQERETNKLLVDSEISNKKIDQDESKTNKTLAVSISKGVKKETAPDETQTPENDVI